MATLLTRRHRVAVVFPRAQPYFCRFFQQLAKHPAIELTVYFYSDFGKDGKLDPGFAIPLAWDVDMWSGFRHYFPPNCSPWPNLAGFFGSFHPRLLNELRPSNFDAVVIHGWWGATTWLALATLMMQRVPILMYSDKSSFDWSNGLRRALRDSLLRVLFKQIKAFLTIGRSNADFYRRLGVPNRKLFHTPLAVDNDFLCTEHNRLQPQRNGLRKQWGIPADAVVILAVSRFLAWKGIKDLIEAFSTLDQEYTHLLLVGEGPQRVELQKMVRSRNISRVTFAGFRNYTEMPVCYAISDIFVLPSFREPWGTVVSEAMNFALPVVCSKDGGAAADLVVDGSNGLLFNYGDVRQLAAHLSFLVTCPKVRRKMGEQSKSIVANWNFDKGVEGFVAALEFAGQEAVLPQRASGTR